MMIIGNKMFEIGKKTYVMGILNVTPDSFSDGGKFNQLDLALKRVEEMIGEGADIIDIGGESTRPGHTVISEEEEIERVSPMIREIKSRFNIPISLDTYKSKVAKAGIVEGVDMINDIHGLRFDANMAPVIKDGNIACCLMHYRDKSGYSNLIEDMKSDLTESIRIAKKFGIDNDKIILDPGIGFGKKYEDNLAAIRNMGLFHDLGYPILLGASRKSFIGLTLNLDEKNRLEGTLATTVMAVMQGIEFVRVHDIKENVRVIRMTEAIMNS